VADVGPDLAPDAVQDIGLDLPEDAPPAAALDASEDVGLDVTMDAPLDAEPDAVPDAPADAAPDAAEDIAPDAAPDAVPDAPMDAAPDLTPVDVAPDACPAGLSRCGDVCIDLATDPASCGACGRACVAGARATAGRCEAGRCVQACEAGYGDCDGDPATGCEVDLRASPAHCGACGNGCSAATLGTDRCVAGRCAARSCAALRGADARAVDGAYLLDLDGPGPLAARSFYCDMTGGGWTLVENQVPSEPLPDETATVNPTAFGRLDASWRLGVPDILAVRPAAAWKLTDASTAVYFRPACVVDWRINYTDVPTASDCTTGYTTEALTSAVNGGWIYCSARGIGVNNSARSCSMRGSEGGPAAQGAGPHGRAYSCNYSSTTERVSLWFR